MTRKNITDLNFDLRKISDFCAHQKKVLRADIGTPNFSVPPEIFEISQKIIQQKNSEVFEYAPTFGDPDFLAAVADFETEKIKNFKNPKILATAGAQSALFSIGITYLNPGDEIITDQAFYPPYQSIAKILNTTIRPIDLKNLSEKDLSPKTKILIINSPNNPTGKIYPKKTLEKIAKITEKKDIIILSDEVYDRIYFDKKPPNISEYIPEKTICINSVSKNFCLAGVRLGWIIGASEKVSQIAKVHRNLNSCPNVFFQKVVAQFLQNKEAHELFLQKIRTEFKERRDQFAQFLKNNNFSFETPQGGMYIFAQIPKKSILKKNIPSEKFVQNLIKNSKISAVPGEFFGSENKHKIRFCFGSLTLDQIKKTTTIKLYQD